VASHNLFDIAHGLVLRGDRHVEPWVEFEMLEGMANHQARAVKARAGGLLLYAPVVRTEDFHSAIAYLVRRLDENTAPENFLRHIFDSSPLAGVIASAIVSWAFDLGPVSATRPAHAGSSRKRRPRRRGVQRCRIENDPDTD
jgi:RHH-type proline utilization regulon transcriptional repressor/proline dehydrogenase/delta 1-pyrroline-5-carboxylate dehydrogenase